MKAVTFGLEQGLNPFEYEKKVFLEFQQATNKAPDKVWSCVVHLTKLNLQHEPVQIITRDHIKSALREASDEYEWSNRTFNNNKTASATVFIFLEKEKIIQEIPTEGIEKHMPNISAILGLTGTPKL